MANYSYTARNEDGETVMDSVSAASRYEAISLLRNSGLTVVAIDALGPPERAAPAARRAAKHARAFRGGKVPLGERALLCRQLSISINSGVALREAVESIAADADHPALRHSLAGVIEALHEGRPFSEAIAGQRAAFSPVVVALIRAAEESGSLPQALEYLASSMERAEKLDRKIRGVLAYPAFVAVFFLAICVIMTLFVLPRFQDIFDGYGSRLPPLTVFVFNINRFIVDNALLLAAALLALIAGIRLYALTKAGKLMFDRWRLRMPLFGSITRKYAVARFCRNLSMMLRGGVPIASGMEIAASTTGNLVLEEAFNQARQRIMEGSDISSSLAQSQDFPRLVVRMVGVGETSGRLPEVLDRVATMYEDQVENSITTTMSLLEPIAICVFGGVVLLLVLAIYVPIFTLASAAA